MVGYGMYVCKYQYKYIYIYYLINLFIVFILCMYQIVHVSSACITYSLAMVYLKHFDTTKSQANKGQHAWRSRATILLSCRGKADAHPVTVTSFFNAFFWTCETETQLAVATRRLLSSAVDTVFYWA